MFLIGFMGCGKSSVAATLADKYGFCILEMDEELERREQMKISDIFEIYGEAYFRDAESALIRELAADKGRVVSCGGGAVLREENVRCMKKQDKIVLLTAKPETILQRVQADENRPILKGRKSLAEITKLMEARRPIYEAAADVVISTDGKTLDEICEELIEKIKE